MKTKPLYSQKIFFFSLCLMIISFTASIALNSILIGVFLFLFLLDFRDLKANCRLYFSSRRNLLLLGIFLSLLLSVAYSEDTATAIRYIVSYAPMVVLPLALVKTRTLDDRQKSSLRKLHITVCLLVSLLCLFLAAKKSGWLDNSYKEKMTNSNTFAYFSSHFTYHTLSQQIGLHAVYLSLFIVIAMIFLINDFKERSSQKKIITLLLLVYFLIFLILLKSAAVIFAFFSLLLLFMYASFSFRKVQEHVIFYVTVAFLIGIAAYTLALKYIGIFKEGIYLFDSAEVNRNLLKIILASVFVAAFAVFLKIFFKKAYWQILAIAGGVMIITAVSFIAGKKEKFNFVETEKGVGINNVNARLGTWEGAWLIVKEHPFMGAGIGDERKMLLEKYAQINFETGIKNNFNAHNQYLSFWIGSGIIAFLCFLILIVSELYNSAVGKNFMLFALVWCFGIVSFTESFMSIQAGEVFFLVFLLVLDPVPGKKLLSPVYKQTDI